MLRHPTACTSPSLPPRWPPTARTIQVVCVRVEAAALGERGVEAEVSEADEPGPPKLQAARHDLGGGRGVGRGGRGGSGHGRAGEHWGCQAEGGPARAAAPPCLPPTHHPNKLPKPPHLDVALAQGIVDHVFILLHHHGAGGVDLGGRGGGGRGSGGRGWVRGRLGGRLGGSSEAGTQQAGGVGFAVATAHCPCLTPPCLAGIPPPQRTT